MRFSLPSGRTASPSPGHTALSETTQTMLLFLQVPFLVLILTPWMNVCLAAQNFPKCTALWPWDGVKSDTIPCNIWPWGSNCCTSGELPEHRPCLDVEPLSVTALIT